MDRCLSNLDFEYVLAQDLPEAELQQAHAHIASCAECRNALAELQEAQDWIGAARQRVARYDQERSHYSCGVDVLADFTMIREIGRGGMGVVYEAKQSSPERRVAVKVLHATNDMDAKLFEAEVQALARLKHQSIVTIHMCGRTAGGQDYLVMELAEGLKLSDYARIGQRSLEERIALCVKISEAVAYAHSQGVVHRDLKPANIIVTPQGEPKILDFGLAMLHEHALDQMPPNSPLMGTLQYMSPEQLNPDGQVIDARSDVYTLGMIFHEILQGSLPYSVADRSTPEAIRIIREHEFVIDVRSGLEEIAAVLIKALSKAPADRYSDAGALAWDLKAILAGEPTSTVSPTLPNRIRRLSRKHPRAMLAGFSCIVLGVAIVVGTLLMQRTITLYVNASELESRDIAGYVESTLEEHQLADPVVLAKQYVDIGRLLASSVHQRDKALFCYRKALAAYIEAGNHENMWVTLGETLAVLDSIAAPPSYEAVQTLEFLEQLALVDERMALLIDVTVTNLEWSVDDPASRERFEGLYSQNLDPAVRLTRKHANLSTRILEDTALPQHRPLEQTRRKVYRIDQSSYRVLD